MRYATPQACYPLCGRLIPWFAYAGLLFAGAGLVVGLLLAPTDGPKGDSYRIIFIHVPAAWMSMVIYLVMAAATGLGLALDIRLSHMLAWALAPTGALMTFIALWTGALWGKPSWGAWWIWDARLTSELMLLFLYLGFMAIRGAIDDPRRADRAGAVIALAGVVNVPVIYYSVHWWNTLHPGAAASVSLVPSLAEVTVVGMLLMVAAFWAYAIAVGLLRLRSIILEREKTTEWVRQLIGQRP